MPELLQRSHREELVTWIGRPCHFQLLYKISRDGCSASTFHQKCDGQGATVTVLYNTNKTIYGGYLSQSWHSNDEYFERNPNRRHLREEYVHDEEGCNDACIYDPNAFIFRLQYKGSFNPMKFPVSNANQAGYGKIGYGPIFGSGHDICTFSGTITSSENAFSLNGHCNLGKSFSLNGENRNTITNNNMKVTDFQLEVYKVIDGAGQRTLEKPWKEHEEWTTKIMQELKETLLDYKPVMETNVTAANILLIGQIGAGKTSFINSVNSIFRGKITSKACSGSFEHSVTTTYRQYKLKDFLKEKFLNFRLCDTRGFEEEFALDAQEISFILDGNIPDRYQFNPLVPFTMDTPGYIKDQSLKDKIHCVAFVIDGSTVDVMSDKIIGRLKDLQVKMNHRVIQKP